MTYTSQKFALSQVWGKLWGLFEVPY